MPNLSTGYVMADQTIAQYRFRTVNQSTSYALTKQEVTIRYRKGLNASAQTIPLSLFDGRSSNWEMSNVPWIGLAFISLLAIAFGVWGLIDPKATGMYPIVAGGLILVGLTLPGVLWQHRRLTGVTFLGEHGYSLNVIAHAVPTEYFHAFVDAFATGVREAKKTPPKSAKQLTLDCERGQFTLTLVTEIDPSIPSTDHSLEVHVTIPKSGRYRAVLFLLPDTDSDDPNAVMPIDQWQVPAKWDDNQLLYVPSFQDDHILAAFAHVLDNNLEHDAFEHETQARF